MPWAWDPRARRYRDMETGRFMQRQRVRDYVTQALRGSTTAADQLAELVAGGSLSPRDFRDMFRQEIKIGYIEQYLLGRGGRNAMTASDWGSVGGMLADQYRYLEGFIDAIERGDLTELQIRARARMYVNSSREAFERAQRRNADATGAAKEIWVVDHSLENCPDCLAFEAEGAQPVGHFPFPGDGSTQCLTNCGCHKLYLSASGKVLL